MIAPVLLVAVVILNISKDDSVTKKWGCKWNMIYLIGAWCFEIILTLLKEVIIFYIALTLIGFQKFDFKWALLGLYLFLIPSLSWLHKDLHEFCKEVFGGKKNKRWNKNLGRDKSLITAGIGFISRALGTDKLILLWEISQKNWRKSPIGHKILELIWKIEIVIFSNKLADLLDIKLLKL